MVSKTYLTWEEITRPYEKNGKLYVKVQKENRIKEVRWYYYDEWAKKYPELADKGYLKHGFFPQKQTLGFEPTGYVLLVDADHEDKWCKEETWVWYHKDWGWYIPNPADKSDILEKCPHKTKILLWEEVGDKEGYLYK